MLGLMRKPGKSWTCRLILGTFKEGASQDNWTLDQDRAHNEANEIESAGGWATPDYDQAGNMTIMPDGNDPANYKL